MTKNKPELSVVIPVYNESNGLDALFERLMPALDKMGRTFEVIMINDGSTDNSWVVLKKNFELYPDNVRLINFSFNRGQHQAVVCGFEYARGETIVTLDSDLQNPPEEIEKLLKLVDEGCDHVEGVRYKNRKDTMFRRYASRLNNKIRKRITGIELQDQGTMLRAYSKRIAKMIAATQSANLFIPAAAASLAMKPGFVEVDHEERFEGESKYSFYKLIRLNFDLMTGYSLVPLQFFTFFGMALSLLSFVFVVYMLLRRLIIGPEVQGVFTLFAISFFFMGILLFGLGVVGEYVGRIFQEVHKQPRYVVDEIVEKA